jgi:hypothetical protein
MHAGSFVMSLRSNPLEMPLGERNSAAPDACGSARVRPRRLVFMRGQKGKGGCYNRRPVKNFFVRWET